MSNGDKLVSGSTVITNKTIVIDGVTYPIVELEISCSLHPFYAGKSKFPDTVVHVDNYMNLYAKRIKTVKSNFLFGKRNLYKFQTN